MQNSYAPVGMEDLEENGVWEVRRETWASGQGDRQAARAPRF